jgi:predicted HAD superfamily Cof-like phosphohydrolase
VNIKIAGKWMIIPKKMVLIGIDPYPYYNILWMEEILHQLVDGVSRFDPIICTV